MCSTNERPTISPVCSTNEKPTISSVCSTNEKPTISSVCSTNEKPTISSVFSTNEKPTISSVCSTNEKPTISSMFSTNYLFSLERSLIAQLRLGILPIHIETGRFRGTRLDDLICQLCDTQEVEVEIHFVCKCNLYTDLRKTMYRPVEHKHTDFICMITKTNLYF